MSPDSSAQENVAIEVEGLGKKYHIGALQERKRDTLVDQISEAVRAPFRRMWRLMHGHATGAAELDEELWALRDISFTVQQGEIVGIIGKNGAGKSTLLKVLSRITEPTEGSATIYGRVGSLLEVGTGFHLELTGSENIYLNGAVLGMTRAEIDERYDDIVEFAEVEKFIDTPVKHYSSGMRVRLAFAVAAHLEPEILLVDEVLAVGDAAFQKKSLGKMSEVAGGGRTVLFVSHQMPMIANLCDRVLLLRDGRFIDQGPPDQIISRYLRESAPSEEKSLAEREDRHGENDIIATGIRLLDGEGQAIGTPVTGREVCLRLHYEAQVDRKFKNARVTVLFFKDAQCHFIVSTALVSNDVLTLEGSGYVDFVIPKLPLVGGNYILKVVIEVNRVWQDVVDRAYEFDVIDGDFFGTGRLRPVKGWEEIGVLVEHGYRTSDGYASARRLSRQIDASSSIGS